MSKTAAEAGHEQHVLHPLDVARIAFVGACAAAVWLRLWEPFGSVSVIGALGLAVGAWPIVKEAAENLAARRMTMELSMTIAIVAAAAICEFFTALIITLFVLVAEVLEGLTVSRGRRAIRDLLEFLPRSVSVRRAGAVQRFARRELRVGDAVLVNPGGRVPVDGTVLSGHSSSTRRASRASRCPWKRPRARRCSPVRSTSRACSKSVPNGSAATRATARSSKPSSAPNGPARPVQRLADRLAGYLVYFALGAAGLTFRSRATPDRRSRL